MTMQPFLVLGRNGQLARCLQDVGELTGRAVVALGRDEVSVSDKDSLRQAVGRFRPGALINTAAFTAVDDAEEEQEEAWRINAEGARLAAEVAAEVNIPMLHLSSDYVFEGVSIRPYREDDAPDPQTAYGRSKLAGELAVAAAHRRHLILRTSWLFSEHGRNFMKTMIERGAQRGQLQVVDDQRGCPTYAGHVAAALIVLAERMAEDPASPAGTYHLAAEGEASWHGFADAIFEECAARGLGMPLEVRPVPSSQYRTRAKRPSYSVLDCTRIREDYNVRLPHWRDGLARAMDRYQALQGRAGT